MKKLLILTLVFMMILSVTACNSNYPGDSPSQTTSDNKNADNNDPNDGTPRGAAKFTDDMYVAIRNGKFGVLNDNGDVIIDFIYNNCYEDFADGLWVVNNSYWGAVNAKNEIVIPFEYSELGVFSEGFCPAKKGNYWGIIDNKNNTVVDFQFNNAGHQFKNGLLGVAINNACGVINENGDYILPLNPLFQFRPKDYTRSYYFNDDGISNTIRITEHNIVAHTENSDTTSFLYDHKGNELFKSAYDAGYTGGRVKMGIVDDNCFLFESKLYDSNGEFILDIKDKIKTSLGVEIFNPAVVDELPGWVRIGTIDNRVNLINSKGELYFNQWLSLSLFNWDGAQFLSDGSLMFRQLGFGLHYYSKNGEDLRNKENIEELGIWNKDWVVERRKNHPIVVRNLLDKKTFEFGGFDGILHGGFNNQNNVAIVIDENKIFYGLFINDKLVYPCEYNNITYDKKEDTFTLTKGSSTTVIRVARNGRVIPR